MKVSYGPYPPAIRRKIRALPAAFQVGLDLFAVMRLNQRITSTYIIRKIADRIRRQGRIKLLLVERSVLHWPDGNEWRRIRVDPRLVLSMMRN